MVGKGGLPPLLFCQSMLTFAKQSGGKPPFPTTSLLHVSRFTKVSAMITRLSQEEARALFTVSRVGRLGCVYEGGPYVVPINYILDGDSIYVHSLPGRKVEALRANPRACLQVDKVTDSYHWRSAIAFGDYQEVTDPTERDRAVRALYARFPNLTPVESVPVHDGQSSVVIFRIRIDKMSGVGEK